MRPIGRRFASLRGEVPEHLVAGLLARATGVGTQAAVFHVLTVPLALVGSQVGPICRGLAALL
jgi:hypothetical protein